MDVTKAAEKLTNFYGSLVDAKDPDSAGGKKVVLTEVPALTLSGIGVIEVAINSDDLADQLLHMTDEKKAELKAEFVAQFTSKSRKKELQAERAFDFAIEMIDFYADLKRINAEN